MVVQEWNALPAPCYGRTSWDFAGEESKIRTDPSEGVPGFEPGNKGFADPCLTTWLYPLKNQRDPNVFPPKNILKHPLNKF